jgi:Domain of unknown function (DUF222)
MSIEPSFGPGERGDGASPHGDDDWGEDAVLDELMAAFGPGEDQASPDGSFGPELDEFMDGFESGPEGTPRDESADPVPECLDAGFLPRGGTGRPALRSLARGGCGAGFASGAELDTALPGPALAGFADAAAGSDRHYADLNDDELIGTLVGWQKTESWTASGRLSAVAELIRRRPGQAGTSDGPAGVPAVWGKFCADELAAALAISQQAAERMLGVAYDLAFRLPGTARALSEGLIDSYKAQIIAEVTRVLDDAGAAAAESLILADLADLADLAGKTPSQIRAMIGRAVLRVDPEAGRQRREQAQRDARVELWREDAGTAAICGFGLPPDEALAADQMISSRARELKAAGMAGNMDQLRVRAYLDALLGQDSSPVLADQDSAAQGAGDQTGRGPGDQASRGAGDQAGRDAGNQTSLAARINLTVPLATLLGLAERPGEAVGFGPIDPELARALAASAATNPATTWCLTVTDSHGHPTAHGCAQPTRRAGSQQPGSRAGPGRRRSGDGGPAGGRPASARRGKPPGRKPLGTGPPGEAGRSSKAGRSSGPGRSDAGAPGQAERDGLGEYGTWRLRPVADGPDLTIDLEPLAIDDCDHRHHTDAHDPSDRLRHLVHIRDGECTWPPCRRNARRCDFEHAIPWEAGGPTCACNAGPRCRHHHHQKQASGWQLSQDRPGYHTWTTPSGRRYITGPTTYPI